MSDVHVHKAAEEVDQEEKTSHTSQDGVEEGEEKEENSNMEEDGEGREDQARKSQQESALPTSRTQAICQSCTHTTSLSPSQEAQFSQ